MLQALPSEALAEEGRSVDVECGEWSGERGAESSGSREQGTF